jgi:16S rRNA (guanine(966)-N(2))-methyltransferase RsmD
MRVSGGEVRGIPIRAPRGRRTRPTSDKVREAVFSVLGESVVEARVLDLFAGSGALAIEALSRGAANAVLVENDPAATKAVRHNLEKTGLGEKTSILATDFRSALAKLGREDERFDIVFLDPPYHQADILDTIAVTLRNYSVTTDDSIIVLEHFGKTTPPESIANIPLYRTRSYGQTSISFYQKEI